MSGTETIVKSLKNNYRQSINQRRPRKNNSTGQNRE